LIVDDDHRDRVHGVTTGNGAGDEARHDVAAPRLGNVAGLVGQFRQGVACDAAGGEGEGGLG
jgi:hypothetical protein